MLRRTVMAAVCGALVVAIVFPGIFWVDGIHSFEGLYSIWAWGTAGGFVAVGVANLMVEYFGLNEINLLGRLRRKLSK